jgi:hypothetical protein
MTEVRNAEPPVVSVLDEGRHGPGDDALWNESWYFDVADPGRDLGAYLRLGLYPNRRRTWFQIVVVGRDRPLTVLFDDRAPPLDGDLLEMGSDRWSVRLEAVSALQTWRVRARAGAEQFADPLAVFRRERGGPVDVEVDLTWSSTGPAYHYGSTSRYEVSARVTGTITVGAETIAIDARGQRDHSWGVRDWWAFGWCWSAGALDDGSAFHASDIRFSGGSTGFGYVLGAGRRLVPASRITMTEVLDEESVPTGARIAIEPGGLDMEATPVALSPILFDADDGRVARMSRLLCRYTTGDGRVGTGWTEWNLPGEG